MAVKRDYGSFSRACQKHFAPMVGHLGFEPLGGVSFARKHDGYSDGLFLQQSQWGSGDFSMTVGFHVPRLDELWGMEPSFSLMLGQRVSESGIGSDRWLDANNKDELLTSLQEFADWLEPCMHFFEEVHSLHDLASVFKRTERIGEVPPKAANLVRQLPLANYGLLLVLAGKPQEGEGWIAASVAGMKAGGIDKYTEPRVRALENVICRIHASEL